MDRNSPCPLDKEYSDQISALLSPPPPPQSVQEYYDEVVEATKCTGVRVSCSSKHGKGVYANRDFTEDELVLKDRILVGAQHSSNKVDCLVCSYCYRFIGSIELQIGRRLYLQSLGLSTGKHCHDDTGSSSSINMKENSPPEEVLKSLISGNLSLPYTSQFALPPVIACPGGCEEEHYCSQLCAESDWTSYHSLLCTGSNTGQSRRPMLLKFIDHANGTNDIFLVAAKAISFTILRYKKLKSLQGVGNEQHPTSDNSNKSEFSLLLEAWKPVSMGFKKRWWDCIALPDDVDICDEASFRTEIRDLAFTVCFSRNMISTFTYLLRNLFVALVIMLKLLMGDDNDSIISIFQSLQLLKDAIFDIECAPLFSLEVYGHIIGMFELNNLDLVVASPVEDYFIYIDDLSQREKEEAERVTRPFLEALGDEYSVSCEGTAFFPIQSCMNHSCCPNAKAFKRDEDKDGRATIIALQPISQGEEVMISYIDEDLPYEERRALLADYGFSCICPRCLREQPK